MGSLAPAETLRALNCLVTRSNLEYCVARVGKTSISLRFVNGIFDKDQMSTVDASFLEKKVTVGEKTIKLNIWDTAGQEKYHALAKNYYQGASGRSIAQL